MKKILAILLVLAMVLGMAACGGDTTKTEPTQEKTGEVSYQKTITVGVYTDVNTKDIQATTNVTDSANAILMLNTLVEIDNTESAFSQDIIPALATEWKQEDETTWTFTLRQGVKFHNGADFKASDIKFTYERGFNGAQSKGKLNTVESVEVVDDYTVKIHLKQNDPDILVKLADTRLGIMSEQAFSEMDEMDAVLIGTGPYKCTEWVQGDHQTFTRFEEYWDGCPKTEEIIIRYIPEAASRLVALQTGEIDYCLEPPTTDLHYVEESDDLTLISYPGVYMYYIWLNVNDAHFSNQKVRQAVAYAINRDEYVAMTTGGNANATDLMVHPALDYCDTSLTGRYEYNIEKAKELLAEAGYPDGFECTIYGTVAASSKSNDTVLQAQLAKIGIKAEVVSQESATYNAGVKHGGSYDLAADATGGYTTGMDYTHRNLWYSSGGLNRCNIEDPVLDQMIDDALAASTEAERIAKYKEVQKYVQELAVWIPVYTAKVNIATKSSLKGFVYPRGANNNYRNIYIEVEQ